MANHVRDRDGFFESIAGFGTAVAIAAGILIAFGLDPIRASVISLIANTTATAFGAIGLPILTLAEVTNLKQENLLINCRRKHGISIP